MLVTMSTDGTSGSSVGGLVPARVGRSRVGLELVWSSYLTVGAELIAILGRAVGHCIVPLVGVAVGLTELGSSELTAVGKELVAVLTRALGNCVG